MRIAMIGTGYVGLVSGACFADFGHRVTCIDKDAGKIERLLDGIMPIYEPGLEDLVKDNARDGRLSFAIDGADAIREADAVFIAVGTPSRRGGAAVSPSPDRRCGPRTRGGTRLPWERWDRHPPREAFGRSLDRPAPPRRRAFPSAVSASP